MRELFHLHTEYLPDVLFAEWLEHHDFVYPVEELWSYACLEHIYDLAPALVQKEAAPALSIIGTASGREPVHIGLDYVGTHIGCHYQYGVLEIDRTALVVGQTTVVEHLEQYVEHVWMRLLYLVEQHHRIWLPPDRLGQLSALVIADVSRRSANETAD